MLCNLLLVLVIIIDPLKILHRGAWITIVNLAIADFIACGGAFVQAFLLLRRDYVTRMKIWYELFFFWMLGVSASFLLLTLLTVQIYMIIKYPMKSRLILTKKKVVVSCMTVWVMAIGLGLSSISDLWTEWSLYIYIGQIAVLELGVVVQIVLKILVIVEIMSRQNDILKAENAQNLKQREVAKTVILLNVALIVTALPYFLAKQIEHIARINNYSMDSLLITFAYRYESIALLNYVVNPILYSLRLHDYRRSLLALFKFNCKNRRRNQRASRVIRHPSTYFEKTAEMTRLNGHA